MSSFIFSEKQQQQNKATTTTMIKIPSAIVVAQVDRVASPESISVLVNSFGTKFQTTFVVYFFYFNKPSLGKTFICKVERLNVKQHRSR